MNFQLSFNNESKPINLERIVIGNTQSVNMQINDQYISPVHCVLFYNSENNTFSIQDLNSKNGVFVNGIKIHKLTDILVGDRISIGQTTLEIEESPISFDFEKDCTPTLSSVFQEKIILPPKDTEGLSLIDDEYCAINFNDDNISYLNNVNLTSNDLEYIETPEFEEAFEIAKEDYQELIRVTISINQIILDQHYIPANDQVICFSNKQRKNHLLLESLQSKSLNVIEYNNNKFSYIPNEEVSLIQEASNDSSMILQAGICRIHIDRIQQNHQFQNISLWMRQKDFLKKSTTQVAVFFSIFLTLLLVDITQEKEPKKLAIIYKKPIVTEKQDTKLTSKEQNKDKKTGHKKVEKSKKIAHLKKGAKKKSTPKNIKVTKKPTPAPKKQLMKLSSNLSSVNIKKVSVKRSPSSIAQVNSSQIASTDITSAHSSIQVGKQGLDSIGSEQSFGVKGLANKGPRDTAYVQTKTVVLGSMDPELLRKILEQYLPQFRHCYQQELTFNADDIKGVVNLDFEIDKIGKVGKINILAKDSRFSKKGINCMRKVLSIISFPKPKGGGRVAVRQPLNFFAEQGNS